MWIQLPIAPAETNVHRVYEYVCGGEFSDSFCFLHHHVDSPMVSCPGAALKFEVRRHGYQYSCNTRRHNRSNSRVQLLALFEAFRSSIDVNGTGSGQYFVEVGTAAAAVSSVAPAVRFKSVSTAVPVWSSVLFYDHQHDGWVLGKLR